MKTKMSSMICAVLSVATVFANTGDAKPSGAMSMEKAYGALSSNVVARIRLWPGLAPGEKTDDPGYYAVDPKNGVLRRYDVSSPELILLKPAQVKSDTLAIVMPGGGYYTQYMAHLKDDARVILDSGRWLAVLHYRIPRRPGRAIYEAPFEDAQRAVRILRSRASQYGYSPKKIGAVGFSAGAHLAALLATSSQTHVKNRIDEIDDLPCHLNFAIPVYPAYVLSDGAEGQNTNRGDDAKILPTFAFDAKTPPMFMLHGDDDYYSSMASVALYAELHKRKIPAQLFIYSGASHGLSNAVNVRGWRKSIVDWMISKGF